MEGTAPEHIIRSNGQKFSSLPGHTPTWGSEQGLLQGGLSHWSVPTIPLHILKGKGPLVSRVEEDRDTPHSTQP